MKKLDRILLVDDDEITNFVNESLIMDTGVAEQVLVAHNGQEALALLEQRQDGKPPSLIFVDINMPVMNGFEFLDAYQQLEENTRSTATVVMLTSSLNSKDIERTKKTGIAEFLSKPLTSDKLKKVVAKHFAWLFTLVNRNKDGEGGALSFCTDKRYRTPVGFHDSLHQR